MQYRKFGKLDWNVSALGFGCMRLPLLDGKSANIDQAEATRMIRFAIDQGVNYIDTAYPYHEKMSEIAVGKALRDGYREKVRLATKLPMWLVKETADFDRFLNEQLEKLQTERIDFYLLHALNQNSWKKILELDLLRRAEAAVADGRIGHIGFSFHDKYETFEQIVNGYEGWDFCQIQYNYMDINNQAGRAGLKLAASTGMAVIVMEPLLGGKLARTIPGVQAIWDTAEEKRSPADWALQWIWNQPEVSMLLSGMSTMEQVEQNLASAEQSRVGRLAPAELELVEKARAKFLELSPIPCTSCEYCLPCPNGVAIPDNFGVYNEAGMYGDLDEARNAYKNWIADEKKAAQCIQCQECESKCPQKIVISEWMPVVEQVLGLGQDYAMEIPAARF